MAVTDDNGNRILNPEMQKETIAKYFEELYSPDESLPPHAHHATVEEKIKIYSADTSVHSDKMVRFWLLEDHCHPFLSYGIEIILKSQSLLSTACCLQHEAVATALF